MKNKPKILLALNGENNWVHIDEAERKCLYFCPDPYCKGELVVKKGDIKQHHFAHKKEIDCFGFETALHYLAKTHFLKKQVFKLPRIKIHSFEYYKYYNKVLEDVQRDLNFSLSSELITTDVFREGDWNTFSLRDSTRINLKDYNVLVEASLKNIRPDVVFQLKGSSRKLLVEIAVSHKVDDTKRQKLEEANLSLLEYDLCRFKNEEVTIDNIGRFLNKVDPVWITLNNDIFNTLIEDKKSIFKEKALKYISELKRLYKQNKDEIFNAISETESREPQEIMNWASTFSILKGKLLYSEEFFKFCIEKAFNEDKGRNIIKKIQDRRKNEILIRQESKSRFQKLLDEADDIYPI